MNSLYYIYLSLYINGKLLYPGVKNKIKAQIDIFERYGFDIFEIQLMIKKMNPILKRLPFISGFYNWTDSLIKIKNPKFIYLRHVYVDSGNIKFFKEIKSKYPEAKILLELPTYPYEKERFQIKGIKSLFGFPFLLKDRYYRKFFSKYVDRIVTYSTDDEIFGIPTIRIQNGIDVTSFHVIKPRPDDDEIRLIAVATLQDYHGYERIIEGLHFYYENGGNRTVKFLIVGEGPAEQQLRAIVNQYHLDKIVVFYGKKTGKELSEIYDQADIGMGSFGLYKRGTSYSSGLKIREYLARGIPVISGCDEDLFLHEKNDFYLQFANDNSPISIPEIIKFYDNLLNGQTKEEISINIRRFAEHNVDLSNTFKPVIEYLLEK